MAFEQYQFDKASEVQGTNASQAFLAEVFGDRSNLSERADVSGTKPDDKLELIALDWGQLGRETERVLNGVKDAVQNSTEVFNSTVVEPTISVIQQTSGNALGVDRSRYQNPSGVEPKSSEVHTTQTTFAAAPLAARVAAPLLETAAPIYSAATVGGFTSAQVLTSQSFGAATEVAPLKILEVSSIASESALARSLLGAAASTSALVTLAIVSGATTNAWINLDAANKEAESLYRDAEVRNQFIRDKPLWVRQVVNSGGGIDAARREVGLPPVTFGSEVHTNALSTLTRAAKNAQQDYQRTDFSAVLNSPAEIGMPNNLPEVGVPYVPPVQKPEPFTIGVPEDQKIILPVDPLIPHQPLIIESKLPLVSPPPSGFAKDRDFYIGDVPLSFAPLQNEPRIGEPRLIPEPVNPQIVAPFAKVPMPPGFDTWPPDAEGYELDDFSRLVQEENDRSQSELFGFPVEPIHRVFVIPEPQKEVPPSPTQFEKKPDAGTASEDGEFEVDWSFATDIASTDVSEDFVRQVQEQYKISRDSWQFSPDKRNSGIESGTVRDGNERDQFAGDYEGRSFGNLRPEDAQSALDKVSQSLRFRDATVCYPNPDMMAFTVCDSEGQHIGSLFYRDWLSELLDSRSKL